MNNETNELLKAKINGETAKATWKELEVFFARGQILLLSKEEDLVDVAARLSLDDKVAIEQLLQSGRLKSPEIDWVKKHCSENSAFWATVVSPYVLIQSIN